MRRTWLLLFLPAIAVLGGSHAHAASLPSTPFSYALHVTYKTVAGVLITTDQDSITTLPTPIDADHSASTGAAGFDILARVSIDAGRATLDVTKLPGAAASLPLKVVADLPDFRNGIPLPVAGQTPSTYRIAFGYDALAATAPATYSATLAAAGAGRVSNIKLDLTAVSPGSSLTVTGELYTPGPQGQHVDPIAGSISYSPVPLSAQIGFISSSLSGSGPSGQQTADLTSAIPSKVSVLLDDVQGAHVRHLDATIDNAPTTLSLAIAGNSAAGNQLWSYNASAVVAAIDAHSIETQGNTVVQSSELHFENMPTSISLTQDSPTHTVLTTSAPIGIARVGFARGGLPLYRSEPAYLYSAKSATMDSLSFRLIGLTSPADMNTGDPFVVNATMAPGPFHIAIADGAAIADAQINDLPGTFHFTASVAQQTISYSGSAPIGSVAIDATNPAGLAGRATTMHLLLQQLPAALDFTFPASNTGSFTFDGKGNTLGLVQALLTSGPNDQLDATKDGILYEDMPDRFVVFARITGLKKATMSISVEPALSLQTTSGRPFVADLRMPSSSGTGLATAYTTINNLPSSLSLSFSGPTSVTYTASSAVSSITLDAADAAGLAGRATAAHVLIQTLPAAFDAAIASDGTGSFDAHGGTIGLFQAQLTSGSNDQIAPNSDGILVEDMPDRFVVFARLTGLKLATIGGGGTLPSLSLSTAGGRPFVANVSIPSSGGTGQATALATINNLPATLALTFNGATGVSYSASSAVSSITADAADPAGLATTRATAAHLLIQNLPAAFDATLDTAGGVSLDAHGGTLGLFQLQLTSGPDEQIETAKDGILLEDLPDKFVVFARLTGLRSASISAGALPSLSLSTTSGRAFVADLKVPSALANATATTYATINNLPNTLSLTFTSATDVAYAASGAVSSITLDASDPAGMLGRATAAHVLIQGLPSAFDAKLNSDGSLTFDAHGATLGLFQAQLTSGPDETIDPSKDGVLLHDLADRYVVFARLTGLKSATISAGALPTLSLSTTGGRVFVADLQMPSSNGTGISSTSASITSLPATFSLSFADATNIAYSASAVVGSITLNLSDPAGLLASRAKTANILLQSLPLKFDTSLSPDGNLSLNAYNGTIGLFQAQLTSGPDDQVPAGKDGVLLEDQPDRYVIAVRLTGLHSATISQGTLPTLNLNTNGGREFVLTINVPTASGLQQATTSADIANLAPTFNISLASVTSFTYSASAPVGLVTFDATNPEGLSGRANIAHVRLQNLPLAIDTSFAADGTISMNAHGGTVGLVEFQLTSGPDDQIDPAYDGLLLEDLADRYVTFARMTSLRSATAHQPNFAIDSTGGRIFKIEIQQNDVTQGKVVYLRATLDHLVPNVVIAQSDVGGTNITYDASQATNSLTLDSNSGARWNLNTTISSPLPAHFEICAASDGTCTGATPANRSNYSPSSSERIIASEPMTLNVFDCQEPNNTTCTISGSPSKYTQVSNLRVRRFEFDTGGGSNAGYLYENTTDHDTSQGCLANPSSSSPCHYLASGTIKSFTSTGNGLQETMATGFWADARLGKWKNTCSPFVCLGSDGKTGLVNCANGTSLTAYYFSVGIGVTSFLC